MRTMLLRLAACLCVLLAFAVPARAQGNTTGLVVATCGSPPHSFIAGNPGPFTLGTDGQMCINAAISVSASVTGFAPASTGTPISVTTGGVTGSLPAGTVVVATNVGTTNGAYCKLGASATTSDQFISPNGGWFAFTVGASTQLTCITSTSTTTVNMVGGAGLPTGTGGGGGGSGGSSAITTWAGGTLGAMANFGTSPGAVLVPGFNAFITNTPSVAQSGTWTVQPGNTANTTPWLVNGTGASGAALAGNPFRMALSDGTNTQNWLAAIALADGVNGNNTGAVAGWLWNGATYDRQPGTTKGTYGILRDAAGNARGANVNASNQLSVSCDNGCSASTSIAGWGGGTLGAMANYGTSPGAVLVPGVNAFITGIAGQNANGQASQANSAPVVLAPAPSKFHLIAANTTNSTNIKGSAGTLYSLQLGGVGSAPAYVKFYDKATAPTCNSDTVVKTFIIPAASTAANGGGSNISIPGGVTFGTGLGICVTTGIADNDNTAVAAATFIVNVDYQ